MDVTAEPHPVWWKRWLLDPITRQLHHGTDPERISWAVGVGVVTGFFPIFGTPTLVCLLAGWLFKLNHPVLQAFKELVYPLHLATLLLFIRAGQYLFQEPLIRFSLRELLAKFKASPLLFVQDFGVAALQGVVVWLMLAPIVAFLIKRSVKPLIVRLSRDSARWRGGATA